METKTKTVKLLLVEDNPDDVFFLRAMLKDVAGAEFRNLSVGESGIRLGTSGARGCRYYPARSVAS